MQYAFHFLNSMVRLLLRSPFHRLLSANTLVIIFTGIRSGKHYAVPVSYVQDAGIIRCFTAGKWAMNLRGGVPVALRLRGRTVIGTSEVLAEDRNAIARQLGQFLGRVPRDRRLYGVALDSEGRMPDAALERAARKSVMIQITLSDPR